MHDDEDFLVKKPKLSVKKAKKKGVLNNPRTQTAPPLLDAPIALVASVYGGGVSLLLNSKMHEGIAPGNLMTELVTGDRVHVQERSEPLRITSILPRQTVLQRTRTEGGSRHRAQQQVLAANVDTAVIVATATNPAFEPTLVDRYIVLCRASGIEPIVCLNKAELTADRHPALDWYRNHGLRVIETSPKTGLGIEALREVLRGKTAILLGKSGAGKSTLTNVLVPGAKVKTQELSEHAQQGQHTTTRSDIHVWESGSYVIDTPGIRTLDVSHVDEDDIAVGFPDVFEIAQGCKFADCQHETEPECKVQEAKETGALPEWRWESYRTLKKGES